MKKISTFLACVLFLITCTSCRKAGNESDRISVYTSFYAMYDFARQIGGDKADITMLCDTSQEPHDFEPTALDIAALSDSDVFIYNGMGMEPWSDAVIDTLKDTDVICVNTSENVRDITDTNDPHLWLNPQNAYVQLEEIAQAFIKSDSKNREYYQNKLNEAKEKIDKLTSDYNDAVKTFRSKDIIVSHEAYMNLCKAFGLNQLAVNGIDNSSDPAPAKMAKLEDFITKNGIKYIFTEPLGTSDIIKTVADDTGCTILTLDPFEGNCNNEDYFTVMYKNLQALKTALS